MNIPAVFPIQDLTLRDDMITIQEQAKLFHSLNELSLLVEAVPDLLLVLNDKRQIIFSNQEFLKKIGIASKKQVIGERVGDVFQCVHARELKTGCGTTPYCQNCGAFKAILNSHNGKKAVQEWRLSRVDGEALDLRVWATPVQFEHLFFTIFSITDISHEKRRQALEHIFFHDVMNIATGLRGSVELLRTAKPPEIEELNQLTYDLVNILIDEIDQHRQLTYAESGELIPNLVVIDSADFLMELASLYRQHPAAKLKTITLDSNCVLRKFISDPTLLRRVLGNLLKNALEASQDSETVRIGCDYNHKKKEICFWVANWAVMPEEIQQQIFNRSFSTKGAGRGLGTYAAKLLTEKYLHGGIDFSSDAQSGTIFRIFCPQGLT
jgi:signal transduction histidine kinase